MTQFDESDACFKRIITATLYRTDSILKSMYCRLFEGTIWILFIGFKILIMIYELQSRLSSIFLLTRNFLDCDAKVKADLLA